MTAQNSKTDIISIVDYLNRNPELFQNGLSEPAIRVVFSDRRKRYTEFYRIRVEDCQSNTEKKSFYWIRIVKNKPTGIILEALEKHFSLMTKVFNFFKANSDTKLHLSCCKPIALLPEFRALVARECFGHLFNSYLRRRIPFIGKEELLNHFFNCGVWLRRFHEYFRDNTVSSYDLNKRLDKFNKSFGYYPQTHMQYITYCHSDYSPRNIFVAQDSVEVIDYVGVEKGFPEQDIRFFENYVIKARFNLLYSRQLKKDMIAMFREGYETGWGKSQEAVFISQIVNTKYLFESINGYDLT